MKNHYSLFLRTKTLCFCVYNLFHSCSFNTCSDFPFHQKCIRPKMDMLSLVDTRGLFYITPGYLSTDISRPSVSLSWQEWAVWINAWIGTLCHDNALSLYNKLKRHYTVGPVQRVNLLFTLSNHLLYAWVIQVKKFWVGFSMSMRKKWVPLFTVYCCRSQQHIYITETKFAVHQIDS